MGTRIVSDPVGTINKPVVSQSSASFFFTNGNVDFPLLLVMIAFVVFGLLMVFSASWDYSLWWYKDPMYQFNRQVVSMIAGIIGATFLSFVNYQTWRKYSIYAMVMTIIFLFIVIFSHETGRGLKQGSYQPSELAKVMTIVYLAVWLHSKREQLHDVTWGLFPLGAILGLIGGLILLQPDNSAAFTVFILGGLLFFLGGAELKQILVLAGLAIIVVIFILKVSSTGQSRMEQFILGLQDLTKASDHVIYSFKAIVNGGVFGVGIGLATTKLIGLPFAPTDSIFAVIAEELGLIGSIGLILLYVLMVWRGLRIALNAPDMLGSLLASGLSLWIGLEALINILVMVGLAPFAGNALPFISYGGSNLVSSFIAIGILMSVSRQIGTKTETEQEPESDEWRDLSANIDLRGRNRRRRISRISSS